VPLVDTNVIRVVERFFGIKSKKKRARTDPELWKFVAGLIPEGRAKEFNLAMLDFAAKVCTAKNPKHEAYLVNKYCTYYQNLIKKGE
jgi:A/G-specific adenine glycosylase